MANLMIVNKPKPGRIAISGVSEETKSDVEELWQRLGPKQAVFVEETDKKSLNRYLREVRTYCENRTDEEGNPAPLVFRRSPVKGLADNQAQFTLAHPANDGDESNDNA